MANKKYSFAEILKEYNKKYKSRYKIDSRTREATITHYSNNSFSVGYWDMYDINPIFRKSSLSTFIYYKISASLTPRKIIDFIRSRETDKLNLKIEILPSSKIRYAYLHTNYYASDTGNLGKSCMRLKEMQKALNLYVKNNVRIVVVVDNKNKIHARALLWDNIKSTKLKNPFTYLDRVYARSDALLPLFYDLAKENRWKRYPTTTVNCMNKNYYIKNVNIANMCFLPFMDTFRYLYPKDNLLTSDICTDIIKHSDFITLNQHTNSGYYPNLDPNRVREALSGNYISKKDAIKVKRYNGYVLKTNIADIDGDYYSCYDNKVMKTKLDGYILKVNSTTEALTGEKIDKNKAVHSDKYEGYIHKSNIVNIKDEMYHKKDTDIVCFNDKWHHISQCFINYDRKEYSKELEKQPIFFYPNLPETWVLYASVTRKGNLVPKEHAIIAYDLAYNSGLNIIEYQEVYCVSKDNLVQLITNELIVNSAENKKYMKKFNNKYYIRKTFKLSEEQTVTLPDTEQTFKPPNKNQLLLFT